MMRAMTLREIGAPLILEERPKPAPPPGEMLIRVEACGVCRTDLHVVDGELPNQRLPIVPGHEVVGFVERLGAGVEGFAIGERVGVPWLAHACGHCAYCDGGPRESLRPSGVHGIHPRRRLRLAHARRGRFRAEAAARRRPDRDRAAALRGADRLALPENGGAGQADRPLRLRRGRAYRGANLPLSGARVPRVHAAGRRAAQRFARALGAAWAGGSDEEPPEPLDAAILFAPVGALVPTALRAVRKGGRVVCGGIHMSDIPSFPYRWLWEERQIVSVANLTRRDGVEFFDVAAKAGVRAETHRYDLADANIALADLREGRLQGAAVLTP